tara:strand:+ start:597 stop:1052 length:456 start_codon:yes stop_codon:yes gene_type:complete
MSTDLKEKSPFTNRVAVIVEKDDNAGVSKMCMDTGYNTNSNLTIGNDQVKEFESRSPKIILETRYEDKLLGQYWYLTTIVMEHAMLYPEGTKENYQWVYAPVVQIPKDEQIKYPIPGRDGEYYQTRLGIEIAEKFPRDKFMDACKRMGVAN